MARPGHLCRFGRAGRRGRGGELPYLAPPAAAQTPGDYDLDNDGLIDVSSLDQLNAIRWDLDGNGEPAAANTSSYAAATRMGCPSGACAGYELTADPDFDAAGNGGVTSTDPYPNRTPIGGNYNSTFDGDGYTISNLLMNNSDSQAGLFRGLAAGWPNWSGRPTAPIAMDSRSQPYPPAAQGRIPGKPMLTDW